MPPPNHKDRGGAPKAPPSVIAATPAAAPEEPVSHAAAVMPAPPDNSGAVDIADAAPAMAADLTSAAKPLIDLAKLAEQIGLPAPPSVEQQPKRYVAVYPIVTADGRVEPGQPYEPTDDAERDLFLAQRVIRPA
jgi:hypothetical protein